MENIIEITQPVFLINLDNPREFSYNPDESSENWKTILVHTYNGELPQPTENEILYKYNDKRGWLHKIK